MKALLLGYYGMGNLGDEMMLFCLRPWLERQGITLTVLSERPAEVTGSHGIPAVENCPLLGEWAWRNAWFKGGAWRVIRAIRQNDALIVGGGDLIRDDRGWRTFFYTLEKMILAILLGKQVYVVNMGIGQPCTSYGRLVLRWVLRRCSRIIVRDRRSEAICSQLGASAKATLAPDIVLTLPDVLADGQGSSAVALAKNPYVLVCLRQNPNTFQLYKMSEERIRTLAASLDDVIERHGADLIFLPFQADPVRGDGDSELHQRVAQAMRHVDRIQLLPWTADLQAVCRWTRSAHIVLAMRLHAAVLALSCGRPTVLMPCDHKIREFGDLMNIPYAIEAATLDDRSAVAAVLEKAWQDSSAVPSPPKNQNVSPIWDALRLKSP